jgi:serine/threonine protein kinase
MKSPSAPPTAWEERGLAPGGRIGGFVIDELITGLGDLFVVFNAHEEASGRLAALKVERTAPGWPQQARDQFLQETRAVASLAEPHILPAYDGGEAAPSPPPSWAGEPPRFYSSALAATPLVYVASQFVFGASLAAVLGDRPRPALDTVLDVTAQVGAALDAAHAIGVFHLGVKPANIFVSAFPLSASPGGAEHVYLADFGQERVRGDIERARRGRDPESARQWPDVDYFAPEQILGERADARADQYSLACVAFRMLAGFAPFARPDRADTADGHVKGTLPSLPAYRRDLPFSVDDVFVRALAKQAGDRYQSCGAFASALRACVT